MVLFAAVKCRNDSKSKVSTFKFIEGPKLRKEWLVKMKRESFEPTKHSRFCVDHFTADCFAQNLAIRTSVSSSFQPRRLNLKKDAVPTIFIFEKKRKIPHLIWTTHEASPSFGKLRAISQTIYEKSYPMLSNLEN